jgi:HAD superfamily hydrolase (TIGR01509 family)
MVFSVATTTTRSRPEINPGFRSTNSNPGAGWYSTPSRTALRFRAGPLCSISPGAGAEGRLSVDCPTIGMVRLSPRRPFMHTQIASTALKAVLFDIDGTLVDSNDAHAHAWVLAFAEHGIDVDFAGVRRAVGMGADKLIPNVSGISEESAQGRQIASRRKEIFRERFLPRLQPLRDADRLVAAIKQRGLAVVAASSAKQEELRPLLEIAGVAALMDGATSSDDAEGSKPDPDIVEAALKRAGATASEALMIGDTPYDIAAAGRAGVATIAFRCGGWRDEDLRGAIAIYDGPWDLLQQLDRTLRGVRA